MTTVNMVEWWNKQIDRADQLATQSKGARDLLIFYAQLLRAQKIIYQSLGGRNGWQASGKLENDLPVIAETLPTFLKTVEKHGPQLLAAEANSFTNESAGAIHDLLVNYWCNPSDIQFFPKAFLQPYARWLADHDVKPVGRELVGGERSCRFCGGNPQVSYLQSKEPSAESGNRDLLCATCLSTWEFRRVVCAHCGEERPAKLGYFHSPELDHIRIEACDTCKHYIKGIDLTRLGFAAPLVDEIHGAPLDLWAREHGYTKIELNLVGL
jgi:formate dehydrogenase accessory protein FdhE